MRKVYVELKMTFYDSECDVVRMSGDGLQNSFDNLGDDLFDL